jgi:7-cyano-7-deazaguanine synthase in queuosine biosynthesis
MRKSKKPIMVSFASNQVWVTTPDRQRRTSLTYSRSVELDSKKMAFSLGSVLNPIQADMLDVAIAVHAADRCCSRAKGHPGKHAWVRRMCVSIPVRNPDLWGSKETVTRLTALLQFMTDDVWTFEFTKRTDRVVAEQQQHLFSNVPTDPVEVALFSGGLDAFSGAARRMKENPERKFILVSAWANSIQKAGQKKQKAVLARLYKNLHAHLGYDYGVQKSPRRKDRESSQRTRGFLFMSLGAVTAMAAGQNELHVYENGIGAINLPLNGSQVGAYNSRPVHPRTIAKMRDYLGHITNNPFQIHVPFVFHTKGEMCAGISEKEVQKATATTFSCDKFPCRNASHKSQCGYCTSCLLRRMSIRAAGLHSLDSGDKYEYDICGNVVPAFDRISGYRKMSWQTGILQSALDVPDKWKGLSNSFPEMSDTAFYLSEITKMAPEEVREKLCGLYQTHVKEWRQFENACSQELFVKIPV